MKGRKMVAHCLFEQSGTFKNEFRKLGIEAYDYDILSLKTARSMIHPDYANRFIRKYILESEE